MMTSMNDLIREEVRVALARKDLNQSELAERLGISKQYLNAYMNGKAGNVPRLWSKVFDELGLELVVQPKAAR